MYSLADRINGGEFLSKPSTQRDRAKLTVNEVANEIISTVIMAKNYERVTVDECADKEKGVNQKEESAPTLSLSS